MDVYDGNFLDCHCTIKKLFLSIKKAPKKRLCIAIPIGWLGSTWLWVQQ
jgi:hypothetical protein